MKNKTKYLLGIVVLFVFFLLPYKFILAEGGEPILNDAKKAPDWVIAAREGKNFTSQGNPFGRAPYGAGEYDTTEFMIGSVSVIIILPESTGSGENWDQSREDAVIAGVEAGANWWKNNNPNAHISYAFHTYRGRTDTRAQTSYEPISLGYSGEGSWVGQIMTSFGYTGTYFDQTRSFINAQRAADGTDWAFIVFVVDSKNDTDGEFADGSFAYSYLGGPFLVMTYDNDNYQIGNMNAVMAHEMGHTFYAWDEYASAYIGCSEKGGYLDYENQNSLYGSCSSNVPCVMRGQVSPYTNNSLCSYTKGQAGLTDSDGDGILDIVDVEPAVSLNAHSPDPTGETTLSYIGTAAVGVLPNLNEYTGLLHGGAINNMTVNVISGIQYRLDGGSWTDATATDGSFNSGSEAFSFDVSNPAEGSRTIEVRAQQSYAGWQTAGFASDTVLVDRGAPEPITNFSAQVGDGKVTLGWNSSSSSDAIGVKIRRKTDGYPASFNDGTEIYSNNGTSYTDNDVTAGTTYYYAAFAYDQAGNYSGGVNASAVPYDATPPPKVSMPRSSALDNKVTLRWNNPESSDFYKVKIVRQEKRCSRDVNDGKVVYDGDDNKYTDRQVKNYKKYCYSFFTYDRAGNYSRAFSLNNIVPTAKFLLAGFGIDGKKFNILNRVGKKRDQINLSNKSYEVAAGDVNGDGKDEMVVVDGRRVKVFNSSGKLIYNFGRTGQAVATGDVNDDGRAEIILADNDKGIVRIFSAKGKVINRGFYPFGKGIRKLRLAAADFNGDDKAEIVVAGESKIRIFDRKGRRKFTPGFFPFSRSYNKTIVLGAGDVDDDGANEIVAADQTKIRVFSRSGKRKGKGNLFVFGHSYNGGVELAVGDLDSDNKAEIIAAPLSGSFRVKVLTNLGRVKRKIIYPFGTGFSSDFNKISFANF